MVSKSVMKRMLSITVKVLLLTTGGLAYAAGLSIVDVPLFLSGNVAPLNMLVVGRDHKLFYEAYADHSDLDGDGNLDVGYHGFDTKPDPDDPKKTVFKIDYFGYFDSHMCYTHDGSKFVPANKTDTKKCSGQWAGDWMNWMTTARIDAMRKVLYGGTRVVDTSTETVIERATIPQDAHSWGKEYTSAAVDGYNISDVAPLSTPTGTNRHLFANTTLMKTNSWTTNTEPPVFRVLENQPSDRRIWTWVSKESPVAGGTINIGGIPTPADISVSPKDYIVRVQVCVKGLEEVAYCRQYPKADSVQKPYGLLQEFGENDAMLFGLLTGSYQKSKSGGAIRKDVKSFKDEIKWDDDGTFQNVDGIVRTLDRLRTAGFTNYTGQSGGYGTVYDGGLVSHRAFNEGEFGGNWGNPVAEMMYEGLRYFSQDTDDSSNAKSKPTGAYDFSGGIDATAPLSLTKVDKWANPYASTKPVCAKPFETVLSDVNTSYDSDQLPGSPYGTSVKSDLPGAGLDVAQIGQKIWDTEFGINGQYFIGESKSDATNPKDGAPTAKNVSSFGNIRGLSPEEPTKEGSYYAASVAYYGLTNDINTKAKSEQKVQTFAVALASPLPRIEIPVTGGSITIIPFGKSVGGCGSSGGDFSTFQPTNQIVDFYIEKIAPDRKSGTFQVNFEDVEAGNDHDMDAIARYSYSVNADNSVTIEVSSDYARGCIMQHLGYVISGSKSDGIYLVVRDLDTTSGDPDYVLDKPVGGNWKDGKELPVYDKRDFIPGKDTSAEPLKDPLWYAAKWGGFKDSNKNDIPDVQSEWDENKDGTPDNYFLVTNALTLGDRLGAAFQEIGRRQGSASSASVNTGSISSETRVYQAKFSSGDWTGQLLSFPVMVDDKSTTTVDETGTLAPAEWSAWEQMNSQTPANRVIITNVAGTGKLFDWLKLDTASQDALEKGDPSTAKRGQLRLNYLRGDDAKEQRMTGGVFRDRVSQDPSPSAPAGKMLPNKLGDIVSSSPIFVGAPPFAYPDSLESKKYSKFVSDNAGRPKMVYVGANDGMLHGFDAGSTSPTKGQEKVAFIPQAVFGNLIDLTKPNYPYNHKFFVDGTPTMGDVFYGSDWHTVLVGGLNKGGRSIYALDITNPANFTNSDSSAQNIFRWEYTDVDLGYTYSRPAIAKMANGKWAAIFGNGYNATGTGATGHGYLYVVDIETGGIMAKIDTGVGDTTTPNGLATPAVVDLNGDSVVDFVYAGDLRGNLWKFDMRSTDKTQWKIPYTGASSLPAPLFTAMDQQATPVAQPITSKPEVGRGPKGMGMVVLFGTGKFLEANDKSPTQTQTFYGLFDPNANDNTDKIASRSNLTAQSIIFEGGVTVGSVTIPTRVTTQNAVTNRGWYLNLLSPNTPAFQGEMQVSNSTLRAGRIIFTTLIPDNDPCGFGGTSWLMEMDSLSGGRLDNPPFDYNNDGLFTAADQLTVKIGTVNVVVSPSGRQSEVGITQGPGILFDPGNGATGGKEYKYLSGSSVSATSGSNLQRVVENPGPNSTGRQSWRQLK